MRSVRTGGRNDSPSSTDQAAGRQYRRLGDNYGGYLFDSNGYSYTPYSLSWRYLGVFIDPNCNNNNGYGSYCRKVLWAAYHDPDYEGQGIAEYSFFQRSTGTWDDSPCDAPGSSSTRCRRLDCHEAGTELELVGVFKETDGLYDFTEQLFKHSGYCLWDEDKNYDGTYGEASDYEFMTNLSENWVNGCTQLNMDVDRHGNYLYYDTKPLPGGDMTYGVYTDSSCTEESSLAWSDVISEYNIYDYGGSMPSMESMERWNALLSDYKICQPCRAYNRIQDSSSNNYWEGQSDASWEDYEEGDDGEGGKDKWGFNCYDDAGYQNCNQCYKFQTQTNMEQASSSDLEIATEQGTMLGIKVEGVHYGGGYYGVPGQGIGVANKTMRVSLSTMALVLVFYYFYGKKLCRDRKVGANNNGFEYSRYHDGRRSNKRPRGHKRSGDNWMVYIQTAHNKVCSDVSSLIWPKARRAQVAKRVRKKKGNYMVATKKRRGLLRLKGNKRAVSERRRRQGDGGSGRERDRAVSEGRHRQGGRDGSRSRSRDRSVSQGRRPQGGRNRARLDSGARDILTTSRGRSLRRDGSFDSMLESSSTDSSSTMERSVSRGRQRHGSRDNIRTRERSVSQGRRRQGRGDNIRTMEMPVSQGRQRRVTRDSRRAKETARGKRWHGRNKPKRTRGIFLM